MSPFAWGCGRRRCKKCSLSVMLARTLGVKVGPLTMVLVCYDQGLGITRVAGHFLMAFWAMPDQSNIPLVLLAYPLEGKCAQKLGPHLYHAAWEESWHRPKPGIAQQDPPPSYRPCY